MIFRLCHFSCSVTCDVCVLIFSPPNRPLLSEASKPEDDKSSSSSIHHELQKGASATIIEETDGKEEREATMTDENMTDGPPSAGVRVTKCGCLVEFVHCYGPVLDGLRMKQLLCSREWVERKTCLTALTQAKPAAPG